jgi:hypothetical protein
MPIYEVPFGLPIFHIIHQELMPFQEVPTIGHPTVYKSDFSLYSSPILDSFICHFPLGDNCLSYITPHFPIIISPHIAHHLYTLLLYKTTPTI